MRSRASTAPAVQKRGLTTLSPIHNLANVQSVSSVDRAVASGLSLFLKGRTNLVRVDLAGRRWNRQMAIPARSPREKDPLLRPPPHTARIRRADGGRFGRHWRNPGRPGKPPKPERETPPDRLCSRFAKSGKFRPTRFRFRFSGFRASTAFAVQKRGQTTRGNRDRRTFIVFFGTASHATQINPNPHPINNFRI
jgi:hypothetical protein